MALDGNRSRRVLVIVIAVVLVVLLLSGGAAQGRALVNKVVTSCESALQEHSLQVEAATSIVDQYSDLASLTADDVTDPDLVTDLADDLVALGSTASTEVDSDCNTPLPVISAELIASRITRATNRIEDAIDDVADSAAAVTSSRAVKEVRTQLALAQETLNGLSDTTTSAAKDLQDLVDQASDAVSETDSGDAASDAVSAAAELSTSLSDARIQAEVDDIIGSTRVGIDIVDLSSGETVYQLNADQSFTTASTYKVLVASAMADAVESGRLTWSSTLNGTTLSACQSTMVLISDNDCPETWLTTYGYDALEEHAHAIGATHTSLERGDFTTTPSDMATVLTSLYSGTLMDTDDTATLLSLMERQIYRDGIASLEPEATVADKVGWLDGIRNDVGIVYSDQGDAVFSIYSEQSSWDMIAELSQATYDWLGERPDL